MQVEWPLHELTSGENVGKKKAAYKWDSRCQQAFDNLKKLYHSTYPCICVLYQTQEAGTEAVIAYTSRHLSEVESHYPAHKLEFLALKWAVVKKFHGYLYGLTFDVHTNNNPLTYVLTTAKLDAASHYWVASLANYNFRLHYRAGKANIDADALLRVSWLGCMTDSSGTHIKVTAASVLAVQEAALKGPASPLEAYNLYLYILDAIQDSKQVACMALEDWHQAQEVDPVLSLVISRLRYGTLGKGQSNTTDPPKSVSLGGA